MFHTGQTKTVKGYINFFDEAEVTKVPFQFNPLEVSIRHGWKWGKQSIPGRSHPHYSGGSGDEETFSFTLVLDADRGTLERRRRNNPNLGDVESYLRFYNTPGAPSAAEVEDLRPLLDKFHQFVLPGEPKGAIPGSYNVPRRAIINLGPVLTGEVGFDSIEQTITKYGPFRHNILRATLGISGHIIARSNVTNRTIVQRSQRNDRDLPDVIKVENHATLPDVTD